MYSSYRPPHPPKWHYQAETRPIWTDAEDEVTGVDGKRYRSNQATIWRWREAYQHDFAARMDWTVSSRYEQANHHPQIVLSVNRAYQPPSNNGASRFDFLQPVELRVNSGQQIELDARQSADPDSDELQFLWFPYREAGTFPGEVEITEATKARAKLTAPQVTAPQTVHIVLQVRDNGEPSLCAYRRIILNVEPK